MYIDSAGGNICICIRFKEPDQHQLQVRASEANNPREQCWFYCASCVCNRYVISRWFRLTSSHACFSFCFTLWSSDISNEVTKPNSQRNSMNIKQKLLLQSKTTHSHQCCGLLSDPRYPRHCLFRAQNKSIDPSHAHTTACSNLLVGIYRPHAD